jgi:hypothetical protein
MSLVCIAVKRLSLNLLLLYMNVRTDVLANKFFFSVYTFSCSESYSKPPTAAILRGTPLHVEDHQVDTINSEHKTPSPLLSTVGLKSATMR